MEEEGESGVEGGVLITKQGAAARYFGARGGQTDSGGCGAAQGERHAYCLTCAHWGNAAAGRNQSWSCGLGGGGAARGSWATIQVHREHEGAGDNQFQCPVAVSVHTGTSGGLGCGDCADVARGTDVAATARDSAWQDCAGGGREALQAADAAAGVCRGGVVDALRSGGPAGWSGLGKSASRPSVRARLPSVRVHSSCAAVINAGFAAVQQAIPHARVQLAVATETVWWRRRALELQWPEAVVVADARADEAFAVPVEIMIVSWPCQPNSAAKHVPAESVELIVRQAMDNAQLVIDIVRRAAASTSPPLLILLENVPGLVERVIFEPCCVWIAAALEATGYAWEECTECPAALCIGAQQRRRWYGVGIRRTCMQ